MIPIPEANDLDLYLYQDFGDGTAELVDASLSVTAVETLIFPEDGDFLIEVNVFSGKAPYFLTIADSDGGVGARNSSRLSGPLARVMMLITAVKRGLANGL